MCYFRVQGDTGQEETEELVEYVGKYQHLFTDRPLDLNPNLPPYDEAGRANLAPITKEEFEAAWIKSFEFLHRMTRSHKGWLIPEEDTGIHPL